MSKEGEQWWARRRWVVRAFKQGDLRIFYLFQTKKSLFWTAALLHFVGVALDLRSCLVEQVSWELTTLRCPWRRATLLHLWILLILADLPRKLRPCHPYLCSLDSYCWGGEDCLVASFVWEHTLFVLVYCCYEKIAEN